MEKKKFKFPDFDKMSYEEEANWWDRHDWGKFWDELEDVKVVVELEKPRDETIVLRVQKQVKDRLDKFARSLGLNLSTLIRMWIMEKMQQQLRKSS